MELILWDYRPKIMSTNNKQWSGEDYIDFLWFWFIFVIWAETYYGNFYELVTNLDINCL
jgi:hypothetical protein